VIPLSIHAWLRQVTVERLLKGLPPDASLLEIGAGLGSAGALLSRRFDYLGLEPDATSFAVARSRMSRYGRGRLEQVSLEQLERSRRFDVICAFEVLEHVERDSDALREWSGYLTQGGKLLVSVPANPDRFGPTDVHAGHFRRYSRESLGRAAAEAGLVLEVALGYGFPVGYALEAGRNFVAARRASAESLFERTAGSGRWLQPGERLARFTYAAAVPWMAAQRPFALGRLGTGIVARLRLA
jgi:SAM-dependent methyltransferase